MELVQSYKRKRGLANVTIGKYSTPCERLIGQKYQVSLARTLIDPSVRPFFLSESLVALRFFLNSTVVDTIKVNNAEDIVQFIWYYGDKVGR